MILFSIFSSIALVSSVMVVRVKNPVHSVLFLILVFCNASANILLLGLDFFALILIIVYVGAIAVLFLFVVMMLNIKIAEIHENSIASYPVGAIIGFILLIELFTALSQDAQLLQLPIAGHHYTVTLNQSILNPLQNIESLGNLIYTTYALYFILGGLILFVAMIGAIVLTMQKKTQVKRQYFYNQSLKAELNMKKAKLQVAKNQ